MCVHLCNVSLLLRFIVLLDEVLCQWQHLLHRSWLAVRTFGMMFFGPHVRTKAVGVIATSVLVL